MNESITICFYDLKGSTKQQNEHDELLSGCLQVHLARISRILANEVGGKFIKSLGDGGMIVFRDDKEAALKFGCGLRDYFENEPILREIGSKIRISLCQGDPISFPTLEPNDYFGVSVSKTARICGACEPNNLLVETTFWGLFGDKKKEELFKKVNETIKVKDFNDIEGFYYKFKERKKVIDINNLPKHISENGLIEILKREESILNEKTFHDLIEDINEIKADISIDDLKNKKENCKDKLFSKENDFNALMILADSAQMYGNFDLAKTLLKRIIFKINSENIPYNQEIFVYHLYGIIRFAQDYPELAIVYYLWSLEKIKEIEDENEKENENYLNLKEAIINRDISNALIKIKFFKEALIKINTSIRILESLLSTKTRNTDVIKNELSLSNYIKGHIYLCQKNYDDANGYYRMALDLLPKSIIYDHRRAAVLEYIANTEYHLKSCKRKSSVFEQSIIEATDYSEKYNLKNRLAEINFILFENEISLENSNMQKATNFLVQAIENANDFNIDETQEILDRLSNLRNELENIDQKTLDEIIINSASFLESNTSKKFMYISSSLRNIADGKCSNITSQYHFQSLGFLSNDFS